MKNIILALFICAFSSCLFAEVTYKDAFKEADENGRPLIVYVGAEWCPGCLIMRPLVKRLYKNHVYLDADEDQELIYKFMKKDDGIPKLFFWEKKNGTWYKKELTGVHSESALEKFFENDLPKLP